MSRLDGRRDLEKLARASRYRAGVLAKKCDISVRQLERVIRKQHGISLHEWLDHQRQKRIEWLIARRKLMKVISIEVGYKDPSHFSRSFKKFHGSTPTSYRASDA
jgi:AraC-like DNA-binding protein